MTVKRTIHERCERCGAVQAKVRGNWLYVGHNCPHAPPGPPDAPRRFLLREVIFEQRADAGEGE